MADVHAYLARVLAEVHHEPGSWRGVRVGVFRRENGAEVQVGEYERNYPTLLRTFTPFQAAGRDLALYSPDYTCTRVMELPSCRDIGGEEPDDGGFCPVEFFVPYFVNIESRVGNGAPRQFRKQMPKIEHLTARTVPVTWPPVGGRPERVEYHHEAPVGPLTYHQFGFVAGCVWADDSSWKVQYLDLARAAEGIVRRDDRFGYIELARGMTLDQAIDFTDTSSDPAADVHRVGITLRRQFDLRTGHAVDPLA